LGRAGWVLSQGGTMVSSGCGESPRQQFLDAIDGMVGDTRQNVVQIGFGIKAIQLRRAD
jgi:hypothetical protein